MSDQKLRVVAARMMQIIQPGETLEAMDRVRQAIDSSGNVIPSAGRATVPLQVIPFWIPGTLAVANNQAIEYVVPEACRVVRIGARVKTAPATVPLLLRFTVNAVSRFTLNISVNAFEASASAASASMLAAKDIVRLDITQVGSAASPGAHLSAYLYVQPTLE